MKSYVVLLLTGFLLFAQLYGAGFQVKGTKLYDAKGKEFIMRGVNYAYAWYTGTVNQSIPAISKCNANTVRIVLANGVQWTKVSASAVSNLIEVCSKNKLIAVLEVHDATGSNDEQALLKAADYFIEIKSVLTGKEDRVIINTANEWYGEWKTETWANGHKKAIKKLRDAGLTHTIMVDAAGWGQYPQSVHDSGVSVFDSDPLKNTMFSIHMYEYAGGNSSTIKNNIDKTLEKNLCLCIGEFGCKHTNGDVDEQYILDYCQEKKVGWLAWSWHGNSSDLSYLDLAKDASGSNLTDWGNTIVNGRNGLKQTSLICSIFDSSITYVTNISNQNKRNLFQFQYIKNNRLREINNFNYSGEESIYGNVSIFDGKGRKVIEEKLSNLITVSPKLSTSNRFITNKIQLLKISTESKNKKEIYSQKIFILR